MLLRPFLNLSFRPLRPPNLFEIFQDSLLFNFLISLTNPLSSFSPFSSASFIFLSLHVLSLGGNLINEVPEAVGSLSQLQALVLCDNLIELLPMSIARLKNLKSLLLHKNRLRHLPKDIVALKNLTEVCTHSLSTPYKI